MLFHEQKNKVNGGNVVFFRKEYPAMNKTSATGLKIRWYRSHAGAWER